MAKAERIAASSLPAAIWRTPVKIRWGHCDAAGMVYTPHYFDIFNGVIEDFYPGGLDLDYHLFMRHRRIGLGYAHVSADFFSPGFYGDIIDFAVLIERIGGASFSLTLHGFKGDEDAVRGDLVVVATSLDNHRPIALPEDLRAALRTYQSLTDLEMTNG